MVSDEEDLSGDSRAQAAQWLVRLRTLPVSRATLEGFFRWRRDDANAAAFAEAERFWEDVGQIADSPRIIAETRAALKRRRVRPRFGVVRTRYAVVALCLCVLLVGSFSVRNVFSGQTYQTVVGERRLIELADGSQVRLDADTRIFVRFGHARRRVELSRGQAFFSVAHNTSRPFSVTADGASVTATGTRFDVRHVGPTIAVTLVQGGVQVQIDRAAPTHLVAGQQWTVRPGEHPVVRAVDTMQATAWTQGRIVLDGMPLGEAIAEVNRYAAHPVRLEAADYAEERIGGSFEAGDVSSFVEAVTTLLPLHAERLEDGTTRLFVPAKSSPKKNL
ncbi:FecR family protein [Sphingomonas abietis]|uniref:FecR domain-containing protein n=1 Tax=Sphingomonas abietis TaxID=3012344 RepID=A0ABY7NY74_9SPHN|nr:FecR domain-containing protein [Sphingomonas abietis]WBO24306.1 FecR domain-containing protein [Sphingomonas abietis]